ncbi:MAG: serpin family protein [Lachnospiraceae bacterium]|nr:serpin family protein [Lachnospiraceae bacterium]
MKKRILQMTAILTAVMMLSAGCRAGRGVDPVLPLSSEAQSGPEEIRTEAEIPENNAKEGYSVNLTEGKGGEAVEVSAPTTSETAGLGEASFALLSRLLSDAEQNENVLISPLSVFMALGMTENGADGETLKQMEKYVNGGIGLQQMNAVMAFYRQKMNASENVSWNIANSLWIKDDGNINPKEEFLNHTVDYYGAEVYKAAFNQGTVDDINGWVKNNTDEMIPEILDQIPTNAFMYLVNATAFEGSWADAFTDSGIKEDYDFTNANGSTSKVTMMQGGANGYFELAGGTGFVKNYAGGEYAFVGILPKKGQSTKEYIDSLMKKKDDFSKAVREAEGGEIIIKLPKFENDYEADLAKTYQQLGMDHPFSDSADFTKMLENSNGDERIGRILHKTHIEVDQNGTKAAAATVVEMRFKSMIPVGDVKHVDLDRPFVYAIVDTETGIPVFIGCQNEIK